MNERLEELDAQAVEYAVGVCDANGLCHYQEYLQVVKEKFAELIIKECMAIAKTWEDHLEKAKLPSEADAVGIVTYRISRQFGVEE